MKTKTCKKCSQDFSQQKCEHCARKRASNWQAANPEKVKESNAKWRAANPEKAKSISAAWRCANLDKFRGYSAAYTAANPEKVNAWIAYRRALKISAPPKWAEKFIINEFYKLAVMRSRTTGVKWHVDHIVPLKSKLVCGLHCEHNLQVITMAENMSKNNRYWPDMP